MSHYREKGLLQASTLFNNKKILTAEHKSFAYLFKIKSYCQVRCFGGINSSFESPFFCELYKVYIHIYTYIYIYIYIYIYNIYIYIHLIIISITVSIYLYLSIYIYVLYVYVCVYIYIYIYINLPVNVIVRLPHPRSGEFEKNFDRLKHVLTKIFIYKFLNKNDKTCQLMEIITKRSQYIHS